MDKNESKLESLIRKYCEPLKGKPIALSGGIDSSLLAVFIEPQYAVTAVIKGEDERFNELKYATQVAKHLGIKHFVIEIDESRFEESMKLAVKAIGRPIPHFNIFPLFEMYKFLNEIGEKEIVLGDGADETMCGYARDLIINYLYKVYKFDAFKNYKPLIDKILPDISEVISRTIGMETKETDITKVDIDLMRPDMDDMANGIAKYFGITNHRPYQDNKELDDFMRNLPLSAKIHNVQYGKYLLRKVAGRYLPKEIAWRKVKVGGICYPVNKKMGWMEKGEYDKEKYLDYQKWILSQ